MVKEIVVVGGGLYGAGLASKLGQNITSDCHITLINNRDHFISLPANLRNSVEDISETYVKPFDRVFKSSAIGTFKRGTVVGVDRERKVVLLEGGEEISYFVLVLAPGSSWTAPNNLPLEYKDVLDHFRTVREQIKQADMITIIGGGAVGIELAGEIASAYPPFGKTAKRVTLVHADELPLSSTYSTSFRKKVYNGLKKQGVEVILNAKGTDNKDGTVTITRGKAEEIVKSDLVFTSTTPTPNTGFVPAAWKDEKGYIRVKPTFQLLSDPNVFALGDATDVKEIKQAAKSDSAYAVAVPNILAVASGSVATKSYSPPAEMMALAMGKKTGFGVATMPCFGQVTVPSFVVVKVKCGDILAPVILKKIGY